MNLLYLISAFTILASFTLAKPQPSIYVFGDSISDTGRLREITLGIVPPSPYWNGRFSSGPIWAEYFSLLQGSQLRNYAVGAAVTSTSELKLFGFLPMKIPSTKDQINQYRASGVTPDLNDIAVLEIGGNDIMTELPDVVAGKIGVDQYAEILANTVIDQCKILASFGFKTILVTNAPPMQHVPLMVLEKRSTIAGSISTTYNKKLSTKLSSLNQTDISIGILNFETFVTNALTISKSMGITDTSSSCIGGNSLNLFTSKKHLDALIRFLTDVKEMLVCGKPQNSFFWDPIHPGEKIHRLFGYYANELLNSLKSNNNHSLYLPTKDNLQKLITTHKLDQVVSKPARI